MYGLIDPKEVEIETLRRGAKTYIIGGWPAMQGLKLYQQIGFNSIPKIGDIEKNMDAVRDLLKFVGVHVGEGDARRVQTLDTEGLVNAHVPDPETLARIVAASLEHNTSFFNRGAIQGFLEGVISGLRPLITKTLSQLSASSSVSESPPSEN